MEPPADPPTEAETDRWEDDGGRPVPERSD